MQYLLGIDVGTTGTKAILFRQDGRIMGQAYCPYPTAHPGVGRSEQNPEDWWSSVCQTVQMVSDDPDVRRSIAALSLSTQGGTTVGLDDIGSPVRPAMVWNDRRCTEQLREFEAEKKELDVYRICGWRVSATAPMLQCRWLQKHEPENFDKIKKFLSVPDYLTWRMTGRAAVDISNAGICRLADVQAGAYHKELLKYAGLKETQLAELLPTGVPVGYLTPKAAQCLNLPETVLVVTGAHDQYAVALGAGACGDGDVLIGSGTSWVVTGISPQPMFESGMAQSVSAVPGKWGSLWSLSSGGVCLEWLKNNIADTPISYEELNSQVAVGTAAEDGLFFYPFSGKAAEGQQFERASFVGLDLSHDKFHMARAIMEAVVFQTVWTMETFPARPSEKGIVLAGGASKSRVWAQILADTANLPVRIPETADLGCVGAAVIAGTGCGLYPDMESGYGCLAVPEQIILPNPRRAEMYRYLLSRYQACGEILGKLYRGEKI